MLSNEELITSRAIILDSLQEITRNSSPVYISVRDAPHNAVYESRFQSVKSQKNHIILHQVLPGDWREVITPETSLEIRSCMKLGHVRFAGYLAPLDDSGQNPYCRLTLPKKIYRRQERNNFRVALTKLASTATLLLNADTLVTGKCKDLSMAGARFSLPLHTSGIELGQHVEQCSLVIEDMLELRCRGKICSLLTTEKEILAGIQFLDLAVAQSRPLNAALQKIERQNINS